MKEIRSTVIVSYVGDLADAEDVFEGSVGMVSEGSDAPDARHPFGIKKFDGRPKTGILIAKLAGAIQLEMVKEAARFTGLTKFVGALPPVFLVDRLVELHGVAAWRIITSVR